MVIKMSDLLKLILSLSLSGTLLIFILLFLRPLYRERLSKRWQYYIWLVVIARLLFPITPEVSLVGNFFYQAEQLGFPGVIARPLPSQRSTNSDMIEDFLNESDAVFDKADPGTAASHENIRTDAYETTQNNRINNAATNAENIESIINNENAAGNKSDDSNTSRTTSGSTVNDHFSNHEAGSLSESVISEQTASRFLAVWLVISLILLVRKITVYQSFVKYVNASSKPVDDITLLENFGQIMTQNHIRENVDLCSNSLVSSPLLIGFVHPRIILPDTNLSENDFYYTILHELTHYKRRDIFYKWLVQLTICLHWFNPFVYLMGYEVNRLCELSCDERVISSLPENAKLSYGDTLLNAVGTGGSYRDTLASVTLNESKELLKGRLEAIMKYRKIPKSIQAAAIFATGILIGGAAVLGAYAMPGSPEPSDSNSASNMKETVNDRSHTANADTADSNADSSDADNSALNYSIQYDDGIYYIYTGGATKADKPLSTVTSAYKKLVLVRKDGYSTFGAWSDYEMQSLVRHISEQCGTMLANGTITQEDADIVISAATEIQEMYLSGKYSSAIQRNYNYTQAAYYQHPYIIEIGYNLSASSWNDYSSASIALSDNRVMPVYFPVYFSGESSKFIEDDAAMSAVTALIDRLISRKAGTSHPLEAPLIISMEYVGDTDVNSLAEKYYDERLTYFGAVFLELDSQTQQKYLDRMFEDNNISFFACCMGLLEDTGVQKDTVDRYILKAYQDNAVNFFAVLSGMLDEEARKQWIEKCWREYNTNYYHILVKENDEMADEPDNEINDEMTDELDNEINNETSDEMDDYINEYFEEYSSGKTAISFSDYMIDHLGANGQSDSESYLSDYLEERNLQEEYNTHNIIAIKNAYYYQNARVRLLLDLRPDGSFTNFEYNALGTIDLKLSRGEDNKILRVEYLTAEEAKEIISDISDDSFNDDSFSDKDIVPDSSSPNIVDLNRISKQDLSGSLRDKLDSLEDGRWYVIADDGYQYIYYSGLPHTYAYEPQITSSESGDLITVKIADIGLTTSLLRNKKTVDNYVLLTFSYSPGSPDINYELNITYNKIPVAYDTLTVS